MFVLEVKKEGKDERIGQHHHWSNRNDTVGCLDGSLHVRTRTIYTSRTDGRSKTRPGTAARNKDRRTEKARISKSGDKGQESCRGGGRHQQRGPTYDHFSGRA